MKPDGAQALVMRSHREATPTILLGRVIGATLFPEMLGREPRHHLAAELAARCLPLAGDVIRLPREPLSAALRRDCCDVTRFRLQVAYHAGRAAQALLKRSDESATAELHLIARLAWERLMALPEIRVCRLCGCTDDWACDGGCTWVEPDLCSACQPQLPLGDAHVT